MRPAAQEFTIYDKTDIAAGLQNFLICLEMFPAAISHAYAFPRATTWTQRSRASGACCRASKPCSTCATCRRTST